MANFYAGYAPCLTRGLWYEQSSPVGSNIAEFSKQTKTGKKRKKKRGKYNFDNIPRRSQCLRTDLNKRSLPRPKTTTA